ncbi:MAG: RidA family protein [Planctomycetota bacterium]
MPDHLANLHRLGIQLPEVAAPVASYVPARLSGTHVYVSGQIPFLEGTLLATGTVPERVNFDQAIACARQCGLNILAAVHALVGLDRVTGVIKLGGFVACSPGYGDHPKVINGASELMLEVFGDAGRHARAAVGVPSLPLDAPVEIDAVIEINPG